MHDQVHALQNRNIPAYIFNSGTKAAEFREIAQKMSSKAEPPWLLYATPEKLASSSKFRQMLQHSHEEGLIQKFAIDEAHCASVWGHDFRPDYKKLGILRQEYPGVPICALTATSTTVVTNDLKKILQLNNPEYIITSLDRVNLEFSVVPKLGGERTTTQIIDCIKQEFNSLQVCGIVYCYSKKDTENLAEKLKQKGVKADHYHAGMVEERRNKVHDLWLILYKVCKFSKS